MNRKAKRNKYRNEIVSKNVEINTLKNEVRSCTNAYYSALSDFRKCSRKLEEQEEKTEEYKKKYFDQLKKEFLEGNKELVTLSLAVPKDLESYSRIPTEQLEEERKKHLCYELAHENKKLKNIIADCYFQAHSEFTDELEKSIEDLLGKDFIEEMYK